MTTSLLLFALLLGAGFGAIAMAFLASTAYDRGYTDGLRRRNALRLELAARHDVGYRKARSAA